MSWFQNLPERVRTVLIWAPIPLFFVIISPLGAWLIFTALAVQGTLEWRNIVTGANETYKNLSQNTLMALGAVLVVMVSALFNAGLATLLILVFAFLIFIREKIEARNMLALGQIVPSLVALMAYQVRAGADGLALLGMILVITSVSDTAAYFVGKAIGKHKFAPKISPNKTWEGAIGGWVFAMIAAMIYAQFFVPTVAAKPILLQLFYFWALAFGGQMGDLGESALKRRYDVKDSADIFPGHGGVLDRFDSFTAVITLIFIFRFLFGM